MSTRKRRGRRLRKRRRNTSCLIPIALVAGILIIIFACVYTGIKAHKFLTTSEFTVEACVSSEECEYDYHNSDIGFLGKASIWIFYKVTDNVNTGAVGSYEVTYDSRLPFMKDHVHSVNVVDTTPPELILNPMKDVIFSSIEEFVDPGFSAEDICDGTNLKVDKTITKSRNCLYTVTYTVSDQSGNKAQQKRQISVIKGQVALTFDDGPSNNITPQILDILANNHVEATFFILGFGPEKEAIVLRESNEGHTIGFHGFSHKYNEIYTSVDTVMSNFAILEDMVYNLTGYSSKLVRFPGGSSNTVSINYCEGIMTEAAQAVKEYGYTYFDWNVDSGDAGSARTAEDVYQNVVSGIRPGRLNVVLMHDSASKEHTLGALQDIIDYCFENDYELVKLDSSITPVTHKIAN